MPARARAALREPRGAPGAARGVVEGDHAQHAQLELQISKQHQRAAYAQATAALQKKSQAKLSNGLGEDGEGRQV